ncbi:hypothetical protein [Pseudoalteromonas piscicida]|nr:hypothetical protein [Pseudoalteromonas piscicida]
MHDLREFTCPALFVQFKWRLKHHDYTLGELRLLLSKDQNLVDIKNYLEQQAMNYQVIDLKKEEVCLEIMDV